MQPHLPFLPPTSPHPPAGKCSFRISCYMLELYCDDLADLLAEHKKGDKLVRWRGVDGCIWAGCLWRVRVPLHALRTLSHTPLTGSNATAHPRPAVQGGQARDQEGPQGRRDGARVGRMRCLLHCSCHQHAPLLRCSSLCGVSSRVACHSLLQVPGATVVDNISSARELMDVIEGGLARRRVSSTQVGAAMWGLSCSAGGRWLFGRCALATFLAGLNAPSLTPLPSHPPTPQMNRESSRSHLIITVCIESTNLQTQSVARGKLSFVDLAGSERCVGATMGWVGGKGAVGSPGAARQGPFVGQPWQQRLARCLPGDVPTAPHVTATSLPPSPHPASCAAASRSLAPWASS